MKKILVSMLFIASVSMVSAQAGQTTATKEEKHTTHTVHKKTPSTTDDNPGLKKSTYKKHYGWIKGKHKGNRVGVKHTTTTTTTTTQKP